MGRSKIITDKSTIIEAAERLLDEEGIEAVSIRRLSKEIQVSSMTLYNYVTDADDIFHEIMIKSFSAIYDNVVVLLNEKLSSGMSKEEAYITAYALALFDHAEQYPNRCLYLTSIGHKRFCNDAELRPFYKPFDILLSDRDPSVSIDDLKEREALYRSIYYIILSCIYEKTSGIRQLSKSEFQSELNMITARLLK